MTNVLDPANEEQTERLVLLVEECAEVIQAATKVLRFGFSERYPDMRDNCTNKEALEYEIGNLMANAALVINNDLDKNNVLIGFRSKVEKLPQYTNQSPEALASLQKFMNIEYKLLE